MDGKSDIDVFVHGGRALAAVKGEILDLFKKRIHKYHLKVGIVPFVHPSPFFIDSPIRIVIYKALKSGVLAIKSFRVWMKRVAPPHELVWDVRDAIKSIERILPSDVPRLSDVLDTFL